MNLLFKNITEIIQRVGQKSCLWKQKWKDSLDRSFKGTTKAVYWPAIVLVGMTIGLCAVTLIRPAWLGFMLFSFLGCIAAVLVMWVLKHSIRFLGRNGIKGFLSWLFLFLICIVFIIYDAFAAGMMQAVLAAFLASLVLSLFFRSIYAVLWNKVRTKTTLISLGISGILLSMLLIFLGIKGFEDTYITTYLNLPKAREEALSETEKENFLTGTSFGSFTVDSVSYGMDKGDKLLSGTVDISSFAEENRILGAVKTAYLGSALENAPLSGKIWYPLETENCPTLFIIHGNHSYTTDSYLGYAYLGEYLASNGYVVVSVNENVCNLTASDENDARAVLLLENIRQVQSYNKDKENILYGKMDYENLAVAGHSRGGEAAAIAYLFNDYNKYPDNGNVTFDYQFNIKSVVAIAPTTDQYRPGGRPVEMADVNYLLLHGANDQDVTDFMGMRQYDNIAFTGTGEYLKTSLYIAGSNHGQFNSQWGIYDMIEPLSRGLNVANFISEQEQQRIAQIFTKIFLDTTLRKDSANAELLVNYEKYAELLPQTLYIQSYQTSDFICISDFEEGSRIDSAAMEGASISVCNTDEWKQVLLSFSSGSARNNYAMELVWGAENNAAKRQEPLVQIDLPSMDLGGTSLQFDIMDMSSDFTESEAELLQATILITDEHGFTAALSMEDYAVVYPAFPVKLNKVQYLFGEAEYKNQLTTVSIPAKAFFESTGKVDLEHIVSLGFSFPGKQGDIVLDNIGLMKYSK